MGTAFGLDAAFESLPELGQANEPTPHADPHPSTRPAVPRATPTARQRWWPRWRAER
jgi:hypothetical protein